MHALRFSNLVTQDYFLQSVIIFNLHRIPDHNHIEWETIATKNIEVEEGINIEYIYIRIHIHECIQCFLIEFLIVR